MKFRSSPGAAPSSAGSNIPAPLCRSSSSWRAPQAARLPWVGGLSCPETQPWERGGPARPARSRAWDGRAQPLARSASRPPRFSPPASGVAGPPSPEPDTRAPSPLLPWSFPAWEPGPGPPGLGSWECRKGFPGGGGRVGRPAQARGPGTGTVFLGSPDPRRYAATTYSVAS